MSLPRKLYLVALVFIEPDGNNSDAVYHPIAIYEDDEKAIFLAKKNSSEHTKYVVLYVEDGLVDEHWVHWKG